MQTFYKDKTKIFECQISVDGANLNETKARLILEFPDRNLLFHGNIGKNGKCKIKIPALKEMEEVEGNAVLEVIAENTHFESWSDKFKLKQNKKVQVEMVGNDDSDLITEEVDNELKPKVTVITENVEEETLDKVTKPKAKHLAGEIVPIKPMSDDVVEFVKYLDKSNRVYENVVKDKKLFIESIVGFKKENKISKEKVMTLVNELKSLNS